MLQSVLGDFEATMKLAGSKEALSLPKTPPLPPPDVESGESFRVDSISSPK